MRINGTFAALSLALVAVFALSACKDKEPVTPPVPESPPATPVAEMPATPPTTPVPPLGDMADEAVGEVTVTGVTLGTAVDDEQQVTAPTEMFSPNDTIYASVKTNGSADQVTLAARWLYDGDQEVNESSETIAPTGPATTTFHIEKSDGWPVGNYSVEISLNDEVVHRHAFTVHDDAAQ